MYLLKETEDFSEKDIQALDTHIKAKYYYFFFMDMGIEILYNNY